VIGLPIDWAMLEQYGFIRGPDAHGAVHYAAFLQSYELDIGRYAGLYARFLGMEFDCVCVCVGKCWSG
jgi:hypothetical protein